MNCPHCGAQAAFMSTCEECGLSIRGAVPEMKRGGTAVVNIPIGPTYTSINGGPWRRGDGDAIQQSLFIEGTLFPKEARCNH